MMTINLKIELSNLDKAMTEIEALKNMVLDLAKTYPTTFKDVEVETPKEVVKKAPRKPRTTKPKPTEEVSKDEPKPEPVPTEDTPKGITLEALTELAKAKVKDGFRAEAKALIAQFSTSGKLSSVPENEYTKLADLLEAL